MKVEESGKLDATDKVYKFSDSVRFEVNYPKDYKKKKHFKEGEVIDLHPVQADAWVTQGLGKIVK